MDVGVVLAAGVRRDDADVVAGMPDESVDQQSALDGGVGVGLHRCHHAVGRFGVASDGAYVGFENG